MKLLAFVNLRTISGQISALVIASIVAIHLILTAIFLINRSDQPDQLDPNVDRGHMQFAAAVQLLGAAPAADRAHLLTDIARAFPRLDIERLPRGIHVLCNDRLGAEGFPRGARRPRSTCWGVPTGCWAKCPRTKC